MIEQQLNDLQEKITKIEQLLTAQYKQNSEIDYEKPIPFSELPALTHLSRSYLYRLTSQNQIPFYKVGNRIYFDRVEIIKWLKRNKNEPKYIIEKASNYCINKGRKRND